MITLTNYQKIKLTDSIYGSYYWTKDLTFETEEGREIHITEGKYGREVKCDNYVSLDDLREAIAQFEKGEIKI